MNREFWQGKRVLITGHTGFKGAWLSLWLDLLGAKVTGFALEPPTHPSLFELAGVAECVKDIRGDIRNRELMQKTVSHIHPEIIFHLAAQPLVRESYRFPVETYETNVMGTVNLLEAVRQTKGVRAVVNITTDKCYENREWIWGYRENEALGGYDPYSSSKACSELVTAAYRNSYFYPENYASHGTAIATARAGNVIGGGDFAKERLIPDVMRAFFMHGEPLVIRNPDAVRPWQHVLEPLFGYLLLAQKLYTGGPEFASAWNFGPEDGDMQTVEWIAAQLCGGWEEAAATFMVSRDAQFHEANLLRLDCSKARHVLGWHPKWGLSTALEKTIEWFRAYSLSQNMKTACVEQILNYMQWEKS
ncbi:MAG: CDP-glucose 4,6-dehydratase [Thermincolia bacterium]